MDAQVTLGTGPGALILEDPGRFELIGVGVGALTWRRSTVEGRYQHGRKLTGAVLDTRTLTVQVRCLGDSWVAVQNRFNDIIAAVSDPFTATVVVDGRTEHWACEPADITPLAGDVVDKFRAMAHMQEYALTIPVYPLPS